MACEQVELARCRIVSFVANKNAEGEAVNYSFVLRGYVRHWLGNVWAEFDRVKLNDLVAAGRSTQARKPGPAGTGRLTRRSRHRNGTPNAYFHRCLGAAPGRQDIALPHVWLISSAREEPSGHRLRRQPRRIRAGRLPAGLHGGRQHQRHPGPDRAVRPVSVPDRVPKVVDLGHALFDKFFALFQRSVRPRGATPRRGAGGAVPRRSGPPLPSGLRHAARPLSPPAAGAGAQRGDCSR